MDHRTIVSDPTVRSEPNLQDECPVRYRTHRNFRIGVWRSWSRGPSTKESRMSVRSAIRTTLGTSPDFGIYYKHHQVKVRSTWRRLSGVWTDPIRGVGCTGVWGDIVV
ncbi:Histidine kinase-, DNA gyrase B-, and HSP90-like ATPase family protein [Prunus dulcis]|uniref:Histidine kinase-, DNA gyrase B-, and HSP90-like ATPase family protein n=1 Tax=Prunus dulcis TaxID=3755 RepID=A0A5H2YCR4_PRUDU|nr:Histidine kinase-, DNA gyrase B-, and HSP90-like ATPase family protein [Prunus dulcis]